MLNVDIFVLSVWLRAYSGTTVSAYDFLLRKDENLVPLLIIYYFNAVLIYINTWSLIFPIWRSKMAHLNLKNIHFQGLHGFQIWSALQIKIQFNIDLIFE